MHWGKTYKIGATMNELLDDSVPDFDVRGRVMTIIFETDFLRREHADMLVEASGAVSIAVFMGFITWACHESRDLCLYKLQLKGLARRLRISQEIVQECLHSCCLKDIEILQYEAKQERWFSPRLFSEAIKLFRKQSNKTLAEKLERFLAELTGVRPNPPDLCGGERGLAETNGGLRVGTRTGIGTGNGSKGGSGGEPAHRLVEPEFHSELERAAWNQLVDPSEDSAILSDNRYILNGRRPMRNYPDIWLTHLELVEISKRIEEAGLEIRHRKYVFQHVQSRAKQYREGNRPPPNCHVWCLDFGLTKAITQANEEAKLKRNKALNGPASPAKGHKPFPKNQLTEQLVGMVPVKNMEIKA